MNFIGVGPVEVGHEGLAQLVPDLRVADGGAEIGLVAVEHQPGAAGYVQGDGLEVLEAVRLAAGFQERPERGPSEADGLLHALHAVEAASGEPGELERDPVAAPVQPDLDKRVNVAGEDAAVALKAVKLVISDIEPLRRLHVCADGAELDGVLVGMGAEHDSVGHVCQLPFL